MCAKYFHAEMEYFFLHSGYSTLLNCNRAVTIRTVLDIPPMVAHLDRVFTGMSIVVTNRTMFYSSQRKNRVFTAVVFRTIFYCIMSFVVTNWTMFLQKKYQCGYK